MGWGWGCGWGLGWRWGDGRAERGAVTGMHVRISGRSGHLQGRARPSLSGSRSDALGHRPGGPLAGVPGRDRCRLSTLRGTPSSSSLDLEFGPGIPVRHLF